MVVGSRLCVLGLSIVLIACPQSETPAYGEPKRKHPKHAGDPGLWCAAHIVRQEYELAVEDCDDAVLNNPRDAEAYANRGAAHMMLDNPERALSDIDHAIGLESDNPIGFFNRGVLHQKKGEYREAVAAFAEAIRLAPLHAFAYHNRAFALENLGERERAIADYRRALEITPGLSGSRQHLRRLEGK